MDPQKQQHRLDSSSEELTLEQKLLLSSSKRQEPQGEEHQLMHTCSKRGPLPLERSTASKSIMTPPSSTSSSSSSIYDEDENPCGSNRTANGPAATSGNGNAKNFQGPRKNRNMSLDSTHSAYNTLIIHQNTSSLLADTWIPASHEFTSVGMGNSSNNSNNSRGAVTGGGNNQSSVSGQNHQKSARQSVSPNRATDFQNSHGQNYRTPPPNPYENVSVGNSDNSGNTTSSELSDIPRDYLNQLTVLKHLAKEVQQDPISGTSPGDLLRSASFSKSQPDLSQPNLSIHAPPMHYANNADQRPEPQQPPTNRKSKKAGGGNRSLIPTVESNSNLRQNNNATNANANPNEEILPSVQILEILMRENSNLKAELVNARRKISTIHKLEAELTRLQASHSALFESAERRESLERSARVKLSSELKRLTAVNRELISTTSLQNLSPNSISSPPDVETLRRELSNKDMTISQLMTQNKELSATRERQDVELAAQRATLAEQRTHIEILDTALTSAQANVLRLEEESGKRQEYAEKASNLQRALSSLQVSNEKREQSEKKLRAQLETEITELKLRLASLNANQSSGNNMCWNMSGSRDREIGSSSGVSSSGRSCQSPPPYPGANGPGGRNYDNSNEGQLKLLQDKLKASEEHILNLNSQVSKWEHVFAPQQQQQQQDNANGGPYRKHSVSTPNTPNSWNSNSRGGTPHFFGQTSDELSHTHHRANDLEWKIKDLESRLVEKDALIRILQSVPNSPGGSSPLLFSSSNSSSMPAMGPPMYRDSPGYSMASTVVAGNFTPSTSSNHLMDHQHYGNMAMANQAAAQLYAKLGQKCESEPPNYANLPLKLRLGGSGSSLVKNSNESLQSGGVSPNVSGSGPGSVSSTGGGGGKSIDDQLKDLDNQLLSKGGPVGSLKIHSGLCCIPGFSHPGPPARKGKISQPLLESLTNNNNNNGNSTNAYSVSAAPGNNVNVNVMVRSARHGGQGQVLPPLPPSTYQTQSHGSGNARTSSGPPFLSPASAAALSSMTTTMSLSNSVDSILSDNPGKTPGKQTPGGANVFTPAMAMAMPKGLPPKSPAENSNAGAGKTKSLERSAKNEPCAGKYTVMMYDQTRCRSLDRREAKKEKNVQKEEKKEKEKGEKLKSSVSSKAAFFQLLSRRSPSPAREKSQATRKEEAERSPGLKARQSEKEKEIDADLDAILLDKQGRSSQSQRNRISSKWSSSNTLESVLEQSGSESPWTQRKNGDCERSGSVSGQKEKDRDKEKEKENEDSAGKKWGRIVKTPFGLRYTFGSPRVATSTSDNCGK